MSDRTNTTDNGQEHQDNNSPPQNTADNSHSPPTTNQGGSGTGSPIEKVALWGGVGIAGVASATALYIGGKRVLRKAIGGVTNMFRDQTKQKLEQLQLKNLQREEKERLESEKEKHKKNSADAKKADAEKAAERKAAATSEKRLKSSFRYARNNDLSISFPGPDESLYQNVLGELQQDTKVAQRGLVGALRRQDIQDHILKIQKNDLASLTDTQKVELDNRVSRFMGRMQKEGRVSSVEHMGDYNLAKPNGFWGRQVDRALPPGGSPAQRLADPIEDTRFRKVLSEIKADGRTSISEGDIHHYLRKLDEPGYKFKTLDPLEGPHKADAKKFFQQMQHEGRLGKGVGIDPYSHQETFEVTERTPAGRGRIALDALRGKKPEVLRQAIADNDARIAAEKPNFFQRRLNAIKRPVENYHIAEKVARNTPEAKEFAAKKLGIDVADVASHDIKGLTTKELASAVPEVMSAADVGLVGGVARGAVRMLGWPLAVGLSSVEVVQSWRHGDSKQKIWQHAGGAAGGLVGAMVADAAVGAGIGAFGGGIGAVPGFAIGLVVGGVGWVAGHYIGGKIATHYTGKAPEDMAGDMDKFKQASASSAGLEKLAKDDGFKDFNEAHQAAVYGFKDSHQYYQVKRDLADNNGHITMEQLSRKLHDKNINVSGDYIANHETEILKQLNGGAVAAKIAGRNSDTSSHGGISSHASSAPRHIPGVEDRMPADQKKLLEDRIKTEHVLGADGKPDPNGPTYYDKFKDEKNETVRMNKAVQQFMADNHLYDNLEGVPPPPSGGDVDGIWGVRSAAAFAKMDDFLLKRKAAAVQAAEDKQKQEQELMQKIEAARVQAQAQAAAQYAQDHQVRTADGTPPQMPGDVAPADQTKVAALSNWSPVTPDMKPVSQNMAEVDRRTRDYTALVLTRLASENTNDGRKYLREKDFDIYVAEGARMAENNAFLHELNAHGDRDDVNQPRKRLYVVYKGDPAKAQQFYDDLKNAEKGLMADASQDLRNRADRKYVSDDHVLPGYMELDNRHRSRGFIGALKTVFTFGHDYDRSAENVAPGYHPDNRTGELVYGVGKPDKHHHHKNGDQYDASLVPGSANGPNRRILFDSQQAALGEHDYTMGVSEEIALKHATDLRHSGERVEGDSYWTGYVRGAAKSNPRLSAAFQAGAQRYQARSRQSAYELQNTDLDTQYAQFTH